MLKWFLDFRLSILKRKHMDATTWIRFSYFRSDNLKSKIENLKSVGLLAIGFAFATCGAGAEAQQTKKVPRIGYVSSNSSAAISTRTAAFRQGMRELGYVEGKNIVIEWRSAEGQLDRLPMLATELVRLNSDLIVSTGGNATASVVKEATHTIPIVVTNVADPVGSGYALSLARPGANITGLTAISFDLAGKRLELIREAVPKVSRVAVLLDPQDESKTVELKEAQAAAKALGLKLLAIEIRNPNDFESVLKSAMKDRPEVLHVLGSAVTNTVRKAIAEFAIKNHLPTMWPESGLMDSGGLMSYGPNYAELYRRTATYVDKILKGAKPGDLPIEQPTKFELIINLKTAKQIGLTIPPNVLARADKVIR
jgi:putative ABC transport system substrate-binding protein